ncbi:hypothetical protein chiPu_0010872 [Chiloscyllium punctatum]|uniref:Uncharacterized protein n=1 Tax=Chiloscyllium punctatum TaxID=137246 RepID=A0A401SPU1_CHIPU|nr:hypothetical protein [Chiloscyllium punctatum]
MQNDSDLHEIELHVVESINDLHRTSSSLEVTKPYSGQFLSRPSTIVIAQEPSANGLVTIPLLEQRQCEPAFSHLAGSESQDRCECSCICCRYSCGDKIFYAVLIMLGLVSIAMGILSVYYIEIMRKELGEISHRLDSLNQSMKHMKFTSHTQQNLMNVTESLDTLTNNA